MDPKTATTPFNYLGYIVKTPEPVGVNCSRLINGVLSFFASVASAFYWRYVALVVVLWRCRRRRRRRRRCQHL